MKVRELMTTEVLTVAPATPLKEVAVLLATRGISGVPVCAEGTVVGVVSEADILFKERGERRGRGGPLAWLVDGTDYRETFKERAETAGEAMSLPVVTVEADKAVTEAARLMLEHGVNRLPVLEGGALVGIVTRADLVRAFARPDGEIAAEIRTDVVARTLWIDPAGIHVRVENGHVTLAGEADTRSHARLIERFTARVPGVVHLDSELTWRIDDSPLRRERQELPV